MEKHYTTYELDRRSLFAWLAAVLAVISMAMRIVYYSLPLEGAEGVNSTWHVFFLIVVPCIACAWFVYTLLRYGGQKKLYKTAMPLLLFMVFSIARSCALYGEKQIITSGWLLALAIVIAVAFAFVYRNTVNPGGFKHRTVACVLGLAIIIARIIRIFVIVIPQGAGFVELMPELSSLLVLTAYEVVLLCMDKIEGDRPFPMAGDRPDGRRLRSLDPISGVAVYIMPDRNGASNLFKDSFECSNAEKYIREKREQGLENFGYTHLILAAYVRAVSQRPGINRFIAGQKVYSRGHDVEVSMAVKKSMATDGGETIINIHFDVHDTAEDVYRKFNEQLLQAKASEELDSQFDSVAGLLNLIPGVLMKFTVWVLKTCDYFGLLPKFLLHISPFHASGFITSMGSLGIPPIYHHLYDFGNIPIFLAFGIKRRQCELMPDGSVVQKKYIDFSVVTDERICDGFYFASAIKLTKRYLNQPERLDEAPETIVEDVY